MLRSRASGRFVAKTSDGGYSASAGAAGQAERFRMQATRLGSYLFYGGQRDFLAVVSQNRIGPAVKASELADWEVREAGSGTFTIVMPAKGKRLATSTSGGELVLGDGTGADAQFGFQRAAGCPVYPEAEVNAFGEPSKGKPRYGEVSGLLDMHVHPMVFEAGGGWLHCGRSWHPYGVEYALPDCADVYGPGGAAAPYQNTFDYGFPIAPRDTRGWPTFKDWPGHDILSAEGVYYRWLERTWRAGLRVFVALNTDLKILCDVAAKRKCRCNEMESVRRQIADNYALQDYVDAQSGGPGKGWYRIVTDPSRRAGSSTGASSP